MIPPDPGPRESLALVHHHPGRLRVRAEAFQDAATVDAVRAALDAEPGITSVAHNARTGSILVEYEPGLAGAEGILLRIASAACLEMPPDDGRYHGRGAANVTIGAARELNGAVNELTGGRADLRALVPAGLAALSMVALVRNGATLPRWDSLLYWSYNIFQQLHRREIDATRVPFMRGEPEIPPRPAVK
jgi:hypothetical protein